MSAHHEADIVTARDDSKWRVIAVERTVVRAEHVDTGVVSHFHADDLALIERHPGGAGGGQS